MVCFRDMTFCSYYKKCKNGNCCDRSLTDEVRENAKKWWNSDNAPIAIFMECPDCFDDLEENNE